MVDIHGTIQPGWGALADTFVDCFEKHNDIGASFCVYVDGSPVVDVWAGLADRDHGRPWERDTPAIVFSTTKGISAILVHKLVSEGRLDLDRPLAEFWPEFAANGKEAITTRHVMTHAAGLPAVEGDWTLDQVFEPRRVAAQLATQAPVWKAGTQHGYHARTYGWLLGEIVQRVTGESLGSYFRATIAEPFDLDIHIGTPVDVQGRLAKMYPDPVLADPAMAELIAAYFEGDELSGQVLSGPSKLFAYNEMWNDRQVLEAEMPSSNGTATARSLAKLYAMCLGEVDGARLLTRNIVDAARAPQRAGNDVVLNTPSRFGTGFMLRPTLNPNAPFTAFGHPGAGGSVAFGDPTTNLALAYAPNQMKLGLSGDDRSASLVQKTLEVWQNQQ